MTLTFGSQKSCRCQVFVILSTGSWIHSRMNVVLLFEPFRDFCESSVGQNHKSSWLKMMTPIASMSKSLKVTGLYGKKSLVHMSQIQESLQNISDCSESAIRCIWWLINIFFFFYPETKYVIIKSWTLVKCSILHKHKGYPRYHEEKNSYYLEFDLWPNDNKGHPQAMGTLHVPFHC